MSEDKTKDAAAGDADKIEVKVASTDKTTTSGKSIEIKEENSESPDSDSKNSLVPPPDESADESAQKDEKPEEKKEEPDTEASKSETLGDGQTKRQEDTPGDSSVGSTELEETPPEDLEKKLREQQAQGEPAEESLAPVAQPPEEEVGDIVPPPKDSGMVALPGAGGSDDNNAVKEPHDHDKSMPMVGQSASSAAHPAHPHRNNRKFAVLITILVSVVLAAVAVFVYTSTANNTKESDNALLPKAQQPADSTPQDEPAAPATVEDVDTVDQEINAALEALDEAEFSEEELSDGALGL